jgi:5-methylcytosine-specific restriction enzyme A
VSFNTTPRRRLSDLQRAKLFAAHAGICHLCGQRIDGVREAWDVDHVIARELYGPGADDDANLAPAHRACHKKKTAKDVAAIRKSDRIRAKHNGARGNGAFATNRNGPYRKRMNGTVERRGAE